MVSTADAYREKQEHLAVRAAFVLDDPMTGDDSSDEQFQGGGDPDAENWSAHINDRPSKRGAAASPQPFFVAREAVSRCRKTLYGAGKPLAGN
jgi:hypothetical protein